MLSKIPAMVNGFTPALKQAILKGVDQGIRAAEGPWYAAFDVKPGQKLYLVPDQRIKIW